MTNALITGLTGQDGLYLAHHLLALGYNVYGLVRPGNPGLQEIQMDSPRVQLLEGDILDTNSLRAALSTSQPQEVYHLAAVGLGPRSFDDPALIAKVNGLGTINILEAIRTEAPKVRFLYASSAEAYGGLPSDQMPITEDSSILPRNPYGAGKAYGQQMAEIYRRAYGLYIAITILFSHESPRRRPEFVVRKVTLAAAHAALGLPTDLVLGNLESRRDWGYAPDFVHAMHLALQPVEPETYVIATGNPHSVDELAKTAFGTRGLDYRHYLYTDSTLFRPADTDLLYGNPSRAAIKLGWHPSLTFEEMVSQLVEADIEYLRSGSEQDSRI